MSKKLCERAGVSESVGHGGGALVCVCVCVCVCVSERHALSIWAPQGEKPRSCRDNRFLEWGGTYC